MTDSQLSTRYGKMSKPEKITCFYEELKKQGRRRMEKQMTQMRIAQDMGCHTITHPTLGTMNFIPDGDVVRIVCEHTNEDSRTGIKRARQIWDEKIQEGWKNK